jgi:hypothetical protein
MQRIQKDASGQGQAQCPEMTPHLHANEHGRIRKASQGAGFFMRIFAKFCGFLKTGRNLLMNS